MSYHHSPNSAICRVHPALEASLAACGVLIIDIMFSESGSGYLVCKADRHEGYLLPVVGALSASFWLLTLCKDL